MAERSLPINLQDATAFLEVNSETWRAVLDAAGEDSRLRGEVVTWDRLRASLADVPLSGDLSDALETILELGTDQGRNIIVEAAEDSQTSLVSLADLPARELVARLWVASRSTPSLQTLLARARINTYEVGQNRHYREFAAKNGNVLPDFDKDKMRRALAKWYEENQDAKAVHVFPYERDGEWYCEVIKGEAPKRVVEVRDKVLSLLEFRPAASDIIRYDPETGRIGIATRSSKLLQTYRSLIGKLVANDEQFFSNENICSLKELQRRGRVIFDKHFSGIVRIDVVELRWRRGDRDKIWVRGRDCFQLLSDLGASLHEGELIEAKLTISFTGGGRQGHVSLKAPNHIDINAGANRELVERMLDEVGIRGSFDDDDAGKNFWSRHPWRMPEAAYRRQLPGDFDRLVREKTVRRVTLEAATHPDHPAARGALQVINVDSRTVVGVSENPAIPSRTLTPSDIEGYELDFEKLSRDVAAALKLDGQCSEVVSGLWSLGHRSLSSTATVAVFLATRPVQATTAAIIQSASLPGKPVLLVPKCCSCSVNLPNVPCALPAGPYDSLMTGIVRALGWEKDIEPHLHLPDDLIIDCGRGRAWLKGVELTDLKPGTHPFKFLELLAKRPGHIVPKLSINEALSVARSDDEVAKKAKLALVKAFKESLSAGCSKLPDFGKIIVAKNGGYVLQATATVLA